MRRAMRYKPLFRVLQKIIGLWFFASGLVQLGNILVQLLEGYLEGRGWTRDSFPVTWVTYPASQFLLGLYLFFAARWIADLAIPGNRPYCVECGYDLSHAAGDACPECGTARAHGERPVV